MTFDPANSLAPYLQTSVFFPDDFDEFRTKFLALYRDISSNVNVRQIGVFDLQEFLTGERWFTSGDPQKKRQTFRKTFEIGALAPGTNNVIPHGITGITSFTHIYGTVVTTTNIGSGFISLPLPYVNVTTVTAQIDLKADEANIYIDLGVASFTVSSGIVVLEYLKN